MKKIELTDDVAKVVERILDLQPIVVRDESHNRSMSFLLDVDESGNSTILSLNRWVYSYLVNTSFHEVERIDIQDLDTLDALCAAWIQFRAKYYPVEPASTRDELGDLEQHPF